MFCGWTKEFEKRFFGSFVRVNLCEFSFQVLSACPVKTPTLLDQGNSIKQSIQFNSIHIPLPFDVFFVSHHFYYCFHLIVAHMLYLLSSFIFPTWLKLTFFFSSLFSPLCSCHLLYNSHCSPQWSESTRSLISSQYSI